jgi:hypothetical protein
LPHKALSAIIVSDYKEVFMLEKKKVAELREIAEAFAVELDGATKKADILARLVEEGVTDEVLGQFEDAEHVEAEVEAPAPKKVAAGPQVLVKMLKANPTYEIRGHRFTSEHPYVAMSEDDAQDIFDLEPRGFAVATPKEVQEYYS